MIHIVYKLWLSHTGLSLNVYIPRATSTNTLYHIHINFEENFRYCLHTFWLKSSRCWKLLKVEEITILWHRESDGISRWTVRRLGRAKTRRKTETDREGVWRVGVKIFDFDRNRHEVYKVWGRKMREQSLHRSI